MRNSFLLSLILNTILIFTVTDIFAADNATLIEQKYLTIEHAVDMSKSNHPLYKNKEFIEKSLEYSISNLNRGYIPDIRFFAKASYQSDVPNLDMNKLGLPIPLPKIIDLSKDQYQVYGEVSQLIFDGNKIYNTKKVTRAKGKIEQAELDKVLYNIQSSVINVYFGILLLSEQSSQTDLYIEELEKNYDKVQNYVANGMANSGDIDLIKVELATAKNKREDIAINISKSYMILSEFTGVDAREFTLVIPNDSSELNLLKEKTASITNKGEASNSYDLLKLSPDLLAVSAQIEAINAEKDNTISDMLPRIDLYLQGGFARPGLNILKNDFAPFYIAGVRFNWRITGFYNYNAGLKILDLQTQQLESQKRAYVFNTKLKILESFKEIESIQKKMEADDEIITLRDSIKNNSEEKLKNGVISVNDLLTDINKLNIARFDKSLHRIELISKIYEIKNLLNEWEMN